jgi:short-subunit dehydrogenase
LHKKLQTQNNIVCRVVEADLSKEGFYETVQKSIEDIDISLLINNAGMNCEGHFFRGDINRNIQMMRLNMEAPFILTYNLLQKMVKNGKGAVIFTASTSSFSAHPYLTHYAATKAYLLSLAESLNYEFKDKGIDIIALCPGPTESEMTAKVKENAITMKAAPVVKSALDGLGKKITCSTWNV